MASSLARFSTSKALLRPALSRGLATPVSFTVADAKGVKVAASDDGSPTSAISVIVKAGPRFETSPGLAPVLKNSVFKSTNKRSALRLVRETEILGGALSASLTREHLILTAEFLKGDEAFFAEVLGDALTQAKFAAHEFNEEVVPTAAAEYEAALLDPSTYALDLAHQIAFRKGLGNSLFVAPSAHVSYTSAAEYAKAAFSSPSNLTVVGSGVSEASLKSLVGDFFVAGTPSSSSLSAASSSYFGGESRVPAVGHGSPDLFLVGFKGEAKPEYTVLKYLLGGESSIKWATGSSPLAKLATSSTSAKAFNFAYSDAGLFGILVSGKTSEIGGVASAAVDTLKAAAKGASAEDVKKAIAQAKFAAAAALETRLGKVETLGNQIASGGSLSSLDDVFAALDKVSVDSVTKAAAAALKSTPTSVAYGNTHALPYASDLSL